MTVNLSGWSGAGYQASASESLAGIGNFRVNPEFLPSDIARNLGLTQNIPTSACVKSTLCTICGSDAPGGNN